MQHSVLERFKRALAARREAIASWLSTSDYERERCLGGCSEEEIHVIAELDEALECTEAGTFGQCERCDGEVEVELLRADFTTQICLSCFSDGDLRVLERDLELAARVQQQLFPRFVPAIEGVEIAAHVRPARIVGGDYYDFFPYSDNTQGAVVADVMGKGLAASMLMSNLQASIRILGPAYDDPASLMLRLNELFRYNVSMTKFISIFLLKIDPEKGCVRYVSAGHNPALMLRASDGRLRLLGPTGPAIGLIHDPVYESRLLHFGAGDVLLAYTDGVSEMRDETGEEFGVTGIEEAMRDSRRATAVELVDVVRERVDAHAGGAPHDDTTLLVIRRSVTATPDAATETDSMKRKRARLPLVDRGVSG